MSGSKDALHELTRPAFARVRARGLVAKTIALITAALTAACATSTAPAPSAGAAPGPGREIVAGALHGSYIDAGRRAPVVLIIPGSGPTDRDGDNPMGVRARPYALLAEALAQKGVSSVRVDKHGLFASRAAGDPNAVTVESYAEDYRAWIAAIRHETKARCVFLLGHSEGALMASAAARDQKDVCGLILVAGAGRPFGAVLHAQLAANAAAAAFLPQTDAALNALVQGKIPDLSGLPPGLAAIFTPAVQPYLRSLLAADPAEIAREAAAPTLVIQGERDLQINAEDARALAAATHGHLALLAGVNHVLKEVAATREDNLAAYADRDRPIAPAVVEETARFIREHARK